MNGRIYRGESAAPEDTDSPAACESFLESYARGNIDVGGQEPPEAAFDELPFDILLNGQWVPPTGPTESQRVRELCTPQFISLIVDINIAF